MHETFTVIYLKRQAITKHLQNIYECDELKKEATSSILELVRKQDIDK